MNNLVIYSNYRLAIVINPEHIKQENLSADWNCCIYDDMQLHWTILCSLLVTEYHLVVLNLNCTV